MLLMCGQRLNEVARMEWREIEPDGKWKIPGERTKNKLPHEISLTRTMRDLIAKQKRFDGCPYVFSKTSRRAINDHSTFKEKIDKAMGVDDWTLHDLRRTCATRLAKLKIPINITEKILNHSRVAAGEMSKIYQVEEFVEERERALKVWERSLKAILGEGRSNVLELRR